MGRMLDPIDRLSEAVYSVLIALIFTLAYRILMLNDDPGLSFSSGYGIDLFAAILGAALAWGIIDGMMYAMMEVFERGERHRLLRQIQTADAEETAVSVIADEFDFILEPITGEAQRRELYLDILEHLREGEPQPVGLQHEDLAGALGSVLVAVLAVMNAPTAEPETTVEADETPAAIEYDLGEATIVQTRFPEDSRFRNMPVRLNGLIAVPEAGDGPFPVVVIFHGTQGPQPI